MLRPGCRPESHAHPGYPAPLVPAGRDGQDDHCDHCGRCVRPGRHAPGGRCNYHAEYCRGGRCAHSVHHSAHVRSVRHGSRRSGPLPVCCPRCRAHRVPHLPGAGSPRGNHRHHGRADCRQSRYRRLHAVLAVPRQSGSHGLPDRHVRHCAVAGPRRQDAGHARGGRPGNLHGAHRRLQDAHRGHNHRLHGEDHQGQQDDRRRHAGRSVRHGRCGRLDHYAHRSGRRSEDDVLPAPGLARRPPGAWARTACRQRGAARPT